MYIILHYIALFVNRYKIIYGSTKSGGDKMRNLHHLKEGLKDEKSIKRFRKEMQKQFKGTSQKRVHGNRNFGKESVTPKRVITDTL